MRNGIVCMGRSERGRSGKVVVVGEGGERDRSVVRRCIAAKQACCSKSGGGLGLSSSL